MGCAVLDRLAREESLAWKPWKDLAEVSEWGERSLAKPLTFMNNSGRAVKELARRLSPPCALQDLLVVTDDFALPLGELRIRRRGSSGGHNGLESVIQMLGSPEFPRLRLGIGPAPAGRDPAEFVLEGFGRDEAPAAEEMVQRAVEAVRFLCPANGRDQSEVFEAAMNKFHS